MVGITCRCSTHLSAVAAGLLVTGFVAGCQNPEVHTRTYFEQRVQPVLDENCVSGTADNKCHVEVVDEAGEGLGIAMGNIDLSSLDGIKQRPDMLEPYGAYPHPILLMKGTDPTQLSILYEGEAHPSEIFHSGGGVLSAGTEAFLELQIWLKNGATEDGQPPQDFAGEGVGECATATQPDVEPFLDQASGASFDQFVANVQDELVGNCGKGSCHGNPEGDFYLTCGNTLAQQQHNYVIARSFVAADTDRSELLLKPLAGTSGGIGHTGGENWSSTGHEEYQAVHAWAEATGPLQLPEASPEYAYFAEEVMPVLLRRGCAMPQCHSAHGFNGYRLRAGSRGFFSPIAVQRNYKETKAFSSLDTANPNRSRILAKNVTDEFLGITHRAGITLLEERDEGGDPSVCEEQAQSPEGRSSYCTVVEWIRLEREVALADSKVSPGGEGDGVPIFYVDRPANPDTLFEFSTFRGNARLMRMDATFDAGGLLSQIGAPSEVDLSACASFSPDELDVRGPELSYAADKLAFALRAGPDDGLNVYVSNLDGSACEPLTSDGGSVDHQVPVHNFDPVFIPEDATWNPGGSIVFASTRAGKLGRASVTARYRLPASNLWRMGLDGGNPEQMTFINGSEITPAVMVKGQVIMSTEKATPDLYQVSGRRINWDLTDYHPLLAQRETIGYGQATEIREDFDRNFVGIFSDPGSNFGGGTLVTFNRSVGPFEDGRGDETGFLSSLEVVDLEADGAGQGSALGAYRSPFPSPDGRILVSYAPGQVNLMDSGETVDYGLVFVDPVTGERTEIGGTLSDGRFQVEAVVGHRRKPHKLFLNSPGLSFGGVVMPEVGDRAWAHFLDLPLLATMLTNNLRHGRDIETMDEGDSVALYHAKPPPEQAPASDSDDTTPMHRAWELVGSAPLAADGSAFIDVPASTPVIIELRRGNAPVLTMTEEFQFGPGEMLNFGVKRNIFDGVCGGCHGSISGRELDVVVNADALTSATISLSRATPEASPSISFSQ